MIQLNNIHKQYQLVERAVPVLHGVSLHIAAGEFVAIMGASGSGKTTLLNIIGCLDQFDQGNYHLAGENVHDASDDRRASLRSQHIGFIFQMFNLIPRVSTVRNVELPMIYASVAVDLRRQRAMQALQKMGIDDRAEHLPPQLSGGQQQRVAIARALVNQPKVLVADEPTGSLDSQTSAEIMQLFAELNADGMTIVMVTHELDVAQRADRIIRLQDGLII